MIKGCQVALPDTVFFSTEGLAELVVANDKEYCMSNDQKIKLTKEMHNIKQRLVTVSKERKADSQQYGMAVRASELTNPGKEAGKKRDDKKAKARPNFMKTLEKDATQTEGERGRNENQEIAIVRYRVDKMVEKESTKEGARGGQDLDD